MTRPEEILTLRDSSGRLYSSSGILMDLRGRAELHTAAESDPHVMVVFTSDDHPWPYEISRMSGPSPDPAHILWPERELFTVEGNRFRGFLARKIPCDPRNITLEQLMERRKSRPDGPDRDLSVVLLVGLNFALCLRAIHSAPGHYVVGDVDPEAFHIDRRGGVYCFSAYECARSSPREGNPRFLAPELTGISPGKARYTERSDAFAFAVILFELVCGVHPFLISPGGEELSGDLLTDRLLDGESLYFYGDTPYLRPILSAVPPELDSLFRRAFDYCGRETYTEGRPLLTDWIPALKSLLSRPEP